MEATNAGPPMSADETTLDRWLQKNVGWNGNRRIAKVSIFKFRFDLIPALRDVAESASAVPAPAKRPDAAIAEDAPLFAESTTRGLTCIACRLSFPDVLKQQLHFKSQMHRVNLSRNLRGQAPLAIGELTGAEAGKAGAPGDAALQEDDGEDGNASDSENSVSDEVQNADSEEEDDMDTLTFNSSSGTVVKQFSARYGTTFKFSDAQLQRWEFSLSCGLFSPCSGFLSREWNRHPSLSPWSLFRTHAQSFQGSPLSAVFLLRSGRFAGVIFDGSNAILHKTLRRYTVRAKAGGGQSSYDNKSGKAKSAGAMLRRYGEQALREDIAALLKLWSGHIQSCSLLLVSAPKTMRSVLFSEEGSDTLLPRDDRVSFVPFQVDKPTLEEAKAVHERCTSVVFSRIDVDVGGIGAAGGGEGCVERLGTIDEDEGAVLALVRPVLKTQCSLGGLISCPASERLLQACLSSETEVVDLLQAMKSNGPFLTTATPGVTPTSSDVPTSMELDLPSVLDLPDSLQQLRTALHLASEAGFARAVYLLLVMGASPLCEDVRGRPPYFVAKDRETRDAFRRFRAAGEERWNWAAAGVGAALSEEAEKLQKQKEKEKKKRAAQRKKEQKVKEEADAVEAQALLELQKRNAVVDAANQREAAITAAGNCSQCLKPLVGLRTLEFFDQHCCSPACVISCRRRLAADAAMRRMESK